MERYSGYSCFIVGFLPPPPPCQDGSSRRVFHIGRGWGLFLSRGELAVVLFVLTNVNLKKGDENEHTVVIDPLFSLPRLSQIDFSLLPQRPFWTCCPLKWHEAYPEHNWYESALKTFGFLVQRQSSKFPTPCHVMLTSGGLNHHKHLLPLISWHARCLAFSPYPLSKFHGEPCHHANVWWECKKMSKKTGKKKSVCFMKWQF